MLSRVVLCILIALAPAAVLAQDGQDVSNQAVLDEIKEQINSLREDLAERVGANEQEIVKLNDRLDQLTTVMNEQDENLRSVVDAISTTDSAGQHVPDLLSNMAKSTQFKQDLSAAVHQSLQTEGTFTINNKTNSYQRIWVNQREYGVNAGQQLTLNKVPVGAITTQLPGQSIENWTLSAPKYSQAIEIVPSSTPLTTVYRPLTEAYSPTVTSVYSPTVTSVYSPPVYYANPSVYYYQPTYYYYPPRFYRRWYYRPW